MNRKIRIGALLGALIVFQASASSLDYPAAAKTPASNTYHGVTVTDDYQWLEAADAQPVRDWLAGENKLSRQWLDAAPGRAILHSRIEKLIGSVSNAYVDLIERRGTVFAMKNEPPKQQSLLVAMTTPDNNKQERVVVDPNAMAADGSIAIDFYAPSLDGRLVAVSLSEHGSEDGTLHIFDSRTGKELGDKVPRAAYPTGGGSVAWNKDGSGFFYTRYPAPGEHSADDMHFYQQVWFHKLGTAPEQDTYEIGKEFPRIAETVLAASSDGRHVSALVANGDGGEFSLYLKSGKEWRKIASDADGVKAAQFGDDGWLYLMSRNGAPRGKILRVSLRQPDLKRAETMVPQGDGTIEHFVVAEGKLYVSELLGGPSRLRVADLHGKAIQEIKLPEVSGVGGLARVGKGQVVANVTSYLAPPAWYRVAKGKAPQKTALAVTSAADFADTEVVREFAVSRDGTKVPLNILRRKGTKLDGNNPTILYGYGGYSVSEIPRFSSSRRVWLDHGGVYVIANLRGGGEYGEAWHLAGNLTHKQTVFDDFIASAEYLVQHGYTSPRRLAIKGGSNGGLLMGAVLTQRPELFRAVSSAVGIYDMLRVELDPNGAFNVTEFGTVKDKAQFTALYAYSPFHHVKDGAHYPSILMMTGDKDGRVNPAHSRKMTARLQAADPQGHPILLRTNALSGHGIGTALAEVINEITDDYAFLFSELGVQVTMH